MLASSLPPEYYSITDQNKQYHYQVTTTDVDLMPSRYQLSKHQQRELIAKQRPRDLFRQPTQHKFGQKRPPVGQRGAVDRRHRILEVGEAWSIPRVRVQPPGSSASVRHREKRLPPLAEGLRHGRNPRLHDGNCSCCCS